ncbi:MAG: hypothetical protein IT443_01745 [Phycisphaeraceae bacterium]|nr:hypothetical protein [Phycisphaeraceae bacterium]
MNRCVPARWRIKANFPAADRRLDDGAMGLCRWRNAVLAGGISLLCLAACTTPPSVAPLLRIVEKSLTQEQMLLQEDLARAQEYLRQQRAALADAFEADLQLKVALDRQWVLEATEVYAAAREELTRHEMILARQSEQRIDNLKVAEQARQRALAVLEQQDQLATGVLGWSVWQQLNQPVAQASTSMKE